MKTLALGLGLLALAWATPAAAQGIIRLEAKDAKPKAAQPAKPGPWEALQRRFDLDKDGTITWEEYLKVTSGFTALDADGDGKITPADMAKRAAQAGPAGPGAGQVRFFSGPAGIWQSGPVQQRAMWFVSPAWPGGMAFFGPGMRMQGGGWAVPGMGTMGRMGPRGPWGAMGGRPWMRMRRMRRMRRMWGGGPPWMRGGTYGMGPWGGAPRMPGAPKPPSPAGAMGLGGAALGGAAARADNAVRLARFLLAPAADGDANGEITADEWSAFIESLKPGPDGVIAAGALGEKIRGQGRMLVTGGPGAGSALAQIFDRDQDGKLEAEDLEAIFKALDKNGDKKLKGDEIGPGAGGVRIGIGGGAGGGRTYGAR